MAKWSSETPPVLRTVADHEPHQIVEMTTKFRVNNEQAEAFKNLPQELQDRLGPPVYGQVLDAHEIRALAARARMNETSSTIMCPW